MFRLRNACGGSGVEILIKDQLQPLLISIPLETSAFCRPGGVVVWLGRFPVVEKADVAGALLPGFDFAEEDLVFF